MGERNLRILVINDSLTDSKNFAKIVSETLPGTKVGIALNGLQGLKLAKIYEPDVILIDVSMSDTESLEISRIIKKEKNLQTTPMLFITDFEDDRKFRQKALEAGAEAFLVKPIDDTILITQLKAMAKIKERNILISTQYEQLEALVEHRTSDLKQEISERKKLEVELKKSEDIFRSYIKKAPIGIFVVDALGQYIEANEMACRMMGRTKKEVLRLSLVDYLVPDQVEKGLADFRELTDKGTVSAEYRVSKKDSQDYWISLFGTKN